MIIRALRRSIAIPVAFAGLAVASLGVQFGGAQAFEPSVLAFNVDQGTKAVQAELSAALVPVVYSAEENTVHFRDRASSRSGEDRAVKTVRLAKGDTVMSVLLDVGVPKKRAGAIVQALSKFAPLSRLKIGQEIVLYFSLSDGSVRRGDLTGLTMPLAKGRSALAYRDFNDRFVAARMSDARATALIRSILVVERDDAGAALISRIVTISRGQTLLGLLTKADVGIKDAMAAATALAGAINVNKLRIGQTLRLTFERASVDGGNPRLVGVVLHRAGKSDVVAERNADGRFRLAGSAAASARSTPTPASATETVRLALVKGDTLFARLIDAGATKREADRAVHALNKLIKVRRLQIGQKIVALFDQVAVGGSRLIGVSVMRAGKRPAVVGLRTNGFFKRGAPDPAALPASTASDSDTGEASKNAVRAVTPTPAWPSDAPKVPASSPATAKEPGAGGETVAVATIRRGDTLAKLLNNIGVSSRTIAAAMRGLGKVYKPGRIRPGHKLVVTTTRVEGRLILSGLVLQTGAKRAVIVTRRESGRYSAERVPLSALAAAATGARDLAEVARAANAPPPDLLAGARAQALAGYMRAAARRETVTLAKGATLMNALVDAGVAQGEAHAAIKSMRPLVSPRKLQAGQKISLLFVQADGGDGAAPTARLVGMSFATGTATRLEIVRLDGDRYSAGLVERTLERGLYRAEGTIDSSLYNAAIAAELPIGTLMELVRLFSFNVDFQRDLQKGDRFELMFERFTDESGEVVRDGEILYASMTLSGKEMPLYRHEAAGGDVEYYDAEGKSVRSALMRTPIDGARLSSRFGMRKHPVLGYSKMHKGVDFAAPRGTPIYAAGNGVVERAGRNGSYGNYIRIRHTGEYRTAYAHLKGLAANVYSGARVRQGQVIGYVGTTGRSTGPHLHYEVLRGTRQVNPMGVKIPTGTRLAASEMPHFRTERERIQEIYARLPLRTLVADGSKGRGASR